MLQPVELVLVGDVLTDSFNATWYKSQTTSKQGDYGWNCFYTGI